MIDVTTPARDWAARALATAAVGGGHLAESARLHRPDVVPIVGERAIVAWGYNQRSHVFYVRVGSRV
jgi:hypothetical protein